MFATTRPSQAPRLLGGAGNEEDMVMLDRDAVEKILPEAHEALCQGISPAKNGGLSTKNGDLSMKHGRIMHISYLYISVKNVVPHSWLTWFISPITMIYVRCIHSYYAL